MKTKIELDFDDEMTAAIAAGKKCCTFRRTRHGIVGDRFDIAGQTYRISHIVFIRLRDAIPQYYADEGFASPAALRAWCVEHYGEDWLDRYIYVHFFSAIEYHPHTTHTTHHKRYIDKRTNYYVR